MTKLLTTLILTLSAFTWGQEIQRCMTPQAIQYQESLTPGFIQHANDHFLQAKLYSTNNEVKSMGAHTIPVVVHVVYNTPEQNIPDSVILDQIAVLNTDYNRQNADTVNLRPEFDPIAGNPQINFVLAGVDPNGNATTGITRTQTATQSFGSLTLLSGDFSDLEKVKSTVDGGEDPWDPDHYLNIWVCNMSVNFFGTEVTALLGYATPPAGLPNWPQGGPTANLVDGVVIQFQAFGSNNPNPLDPGTGPIDVRGRTPVHEVGHYLGLRHIWGDGDCTAHDGIDDTPNADSQSNSDCDVMKNTCTDTILGLDLPDMVENYMDYSAETCQNSFTQGQVDLMKGVLEVERYDLAHNNPAAAVEEHQMYLVEIFPNPTESSFVIQAKDISIEEVLLISLDGKQVMSKTNYCNGDKIDVSQLVNGVYIVQLISQEEVIGVERIVIK